MRAGVWSLGPAEVKEAVQSNHAVMRDLLKDEPGCTGRRLEDLADAKRIGQSFFRKWKKEMVESGKVLVEHGDKRRRAADVDDIFSALRRRVQTNPHRLKTCQDRLRNQWPGGAKR